MHLPVVQLSPLVRTLQLRLATVSCAALAANLNVDIGSQVLSTYHHTKHLTTGLSCMATPNTTGQSAVYAIYCSKSLSAIFLDFAACFLCAARSSETIASPAGEYAEEDGHPLVYASLLNHASYSFDAPTPIPKGSTGDSRAPSQQQWAKTSEVKAAWPS